MPPLMGVEEDVVPSHDDAAEEIALLRDAEVGVDGNLVFEAEAERDLVDA